jgi:hypothetical protein
VIVETAYRAAIPGHVRGPAPHCRTLALVVGLLAAGLAGAADEQLVTTGESGALHAWDMTTGDGRPLDGHQGQVYSLSFTPDGTLVSLGADHTVRFWDRATGRERFPITVPDHARGGAVASPDRRVVATWDSWGSKSDDHLEFWDATTGEPAKMRTGPRVKHVRTAQFSPDGKTILVGTGEGILVCDPLAGKRIRTLPGESQLGIAFSPDGGTWFRSALRLSRPPGWNRWYGSGTWPPAPRAPRPGLIRDTPSACWNTPARPRHGRSCEGSRAARRRPA